MLSPLQQRVARIVTALPVAEGFALAGGAALVLAEVVERETRDLDFFGPTNAQVEQLLPELEAALRADGLDVTVTRAGHGFARLTISGQDGSTTELDDVGDVEECWQRFDLAGAGRRGAWCTSPRRRISPPEPMSASTPRRWSEPRCA